MSTPPNPLRPALDAFFSRLNIIAGQLYFFDQQARELQKLISRKLQGKNPLHPRFLINSTVPYFDFSSTTQEEYSSGWHLLSDEAFLSEIDHIVQRFTAFSIAQAYEAFESFLIDVLAAYYQHNPADAVASAMKQFAKKHPLLSPSGPVTSVEWRQFVKFICRKSTVKDWHFKELRKRAPTLQQYEASNFLSINLPEWYANIAKVRHAVTHADCILKDDQLTKMQPSHRESLIDRFTRIHDPTKGGYTLDLHPVHASMENILFASYAFLIYAEISKAKDYPMDNTEATP